MPTTSTPDASPQLRVDLDDLQRVLDAARPAVDRQRAIRDSVDAGAFDRAIAHRIVCAFERTRDAANDADLAR